MDKPDTTPAPAPATTEPPKPEARTCLACGYNPKQHGEIPCGH